VIDGTSIRLRAWQDKDIPVMKVLRNDVALQAQLLARARGNDDSQVRRWLDERSTGDDSLLYIIADRESDAALGYLQLIGIDPLDHRAELGICLAPQAQGRHVGRDSLLLLLTHVQQTRDLRKISLRVRADNPSAIRCYQNVGFEQCGLLHEHVYIDNAWQDLVLMEIFLRRKS
jgi:RimJ/RimL family protein N-acetyltransferase